MPRPLRTSCRWSSRAHRATAERGFAPGVDSTAGWRAPQPPNPSPIRRKALEIVLGNHRTPHSTYIQAAGDGQCIRATELRKAMDAKDSIRGLFLKYVQAFVVQTAHTAICNARAKLDQRLARWILMAHDRLGVDTLPLTHEFLSLMLGVRRAGVTEAMQALEGRGLIRCARGQIVVRDRKGIERSAGGSYGVPEAEFRRLIG